MSAELNKCEQCKGAGYALPPSGEYTEPCDACKGEGRTPPAAPGLSQATVAGELPPLPWGDDFEAWLEPRRQKDVAEAFHSYARAALHARWCAEVNADGLREENAELRKENAELRAQRPAIPGAVASVKTWQERVNADFLAYWKRRGYNPAEAAMLAEIADLRAQLAQHERAYNIVVEQCRDLSYAQLARQGQGEPVAIVVLKSGQLHIDLLDVSLNVGDHLYLAAPTAPASARQEPVAWANPRDIESDTHIDCWAYKTTNYTMPLYDHPLTVKSFELVDCGTCGCQVSLPVEYAAPASAQPADTVRQALEDLCAALPDVMPSPAGDGYRNTGKWAQGNSYALRGHTATVTYRADDMEGVYAALDAANAALLAHPSGAQPDQRESAAQEWRNCPDCEGSGRISTKELCGICNESGVLPAAPQVPAVRAAVLDGWKVVPAEPTDDMIAAFAEQWYSKVRCIDDCEMEDCYAAMLAAAPSPDTATGTVVQPADPRIEAFYKLRDIAERDGDPEAASIISAAIARLGAVVQPVAKTGEQSDEALNSARYLWLRDKSEPGICAFYLSVGPAFKNIKFAPKTVDEAIDAQITQQGQNSAKGGDQ